MVRILLDGEPPPDWVLAVWRHLKIKEGWFSVVLLAFIVLSTVWSVEAAGWVTKFPSLGWIALAGMAFGFTFAKLHFRGLVLHPLAFVYGIGIVTWQTMTVIDLPTWDDRFVNLVLRLNAWGYAARTGGINTDNLVFVFILVCLAWLLGYLSSWFVFRSHHIWWGVVPSGVAILTNLRYAPTNVALWFVVYLFCALLLFVRLSFFLQERKWEQLQISYTPQMSRAYFPTAIMVTAGILLTAWVTPSSAASSLVSDAWHSVNGPWQEFQGDFNRLFASITSQVEDSYNSFGQTMVLKGRVILGNKIVMTVAADEAHYWRATSYDTYAGRGWVNSEQTGVPTRPFYYLAYGRQYLQRKDITQTVSVRIPKNDIVLGAGQPVRLDIPVLVEAGRVSIFTINLTDRSQDSSLPPDVRRYADRIRLSVERAKHYNDLSESTPLSSVFGDFSPDLQVNRLLWKDPSTPAAAEVMRTSSYPMDVVSIRAPQHLKTGSEYTVVSSVSTATEKQLRTAGTSYPDWVLERYLQIPADFPRRVGELAESVTRNAANPYDKAVAIEEYLRKIRYNQNISAPPATVDPIDYFLFTSREGYCDYYASAMVMMLRSQGIPARIATGYLPGSFDSEKGVYTVREANAHAWPEVFFPQYGWIEFEPTASVQTIPRALDPEDASSAPPTARGGLAEETPPDDLPTDDGSPDIVTNAQSRSDASPFAAVLGVILLVGVLGGVLWLASRRSFKRVVPPVQVYEKMCRLASLAGLSPRPSQTPYEYSDFLGLAIPEKASDITRIASVFTYSRYGRRRLPSYELESFAGAWRRVRNRLLRRIVARR